jgi:hypothetical protein
MDWWTKKNDDGRKEKERERKVNVGNADGTLGVRSGDGRRWGADNGFKREGWWVGGWVGIR